MRNGFRYSFDRIVLLNLLRDRDVVVDAGANFGWLSLLKSNIVGKRGHLHAFEPVPPTFKRLTNLLAEHGVVNNVSRNEQGLPINRAA